MLNEHNPYRCGVCNATVRQELCANPVCPSKPENRVQPRDPAPASAEGWREAARICRDAYCKIVPGKRQWHELSEQEQRVDIVCLKAGYDYINSLAAPASPLGQELGQDGSKKAGRAVRSPEHLRALSYRQGWWTFDEQAAQEDGEHLYYFAPSNRAPSPYTTQRHVDAIIDIASDGTLAGVELIDKMPPPPNGNGSGVIASHVPHDGNSPDTSALGQEWAPPKSTHYITKEGGRWQEFTKDTNVDVFAVKFNNGWIWDRKVGWRNFG